MESPARAGMFVAGTSLSRLFWLSCFKVFVAEGPAKPAARS